MKAVRIVLYVVAGIVVAAALGIGAVFYFTQGAATAADDFLSTIAEAGPAAGYRQVSPAFRATQSQETFALWVERLGLRDYKSASWNERSISGSRAELKGTLTLRNGARLPAAVTLTKNAAGVWQVVFLDIQPVGIAAQPGQPPLPDDAASASLARTSLARLAEAINQDDFAAFHAQTSHLMQLQMTADKIRAGYTQFIEQKIDLSPAAKLDPIFSAPPAIGSDGALTLRGYFPTTPQPWYFKLTYVYEHPAWKLIGIAVSSNPK
jgi:hypothetical protein